MPNDTLAATAASMPTRRSALTSILAGSSAFLAAPAAIALTANPDAELLALQPEIDAAYREFEAAFDITTVAERQVFALRSMPEKPIAPASDPAIMEAIEEFGKRMNEIRAMGRAGPSAERLAYEEALRQWELDEARVRAESGIDAAEAAKGAALNVIVALETRIVQTPAETLRGIIFKAKYAAAHDFNEEVMQSIVDDLLDMAGEA